MRDQKQFWDDIHVSEGIFNGMNTSTEFADEVLNIIKPHAKILDLGCGLGYDAVAFAKTGHTVIATDFSEIAIKKNTEQFKEYSTLAFEVLDMNEPFNFADNVFDVVYARLSLHYFTDKITRQIFSEMYRVLKPNGYLCFMCKSIDAPIYGEGKEIEKDMFESKGHVRHFFSEDYAKSLLEHNFTINKLESGDKKLYGKDSAFVKVIAQAVKQ